MLRGNKIPLVLAAVFLVPVPGRADDDTAFDQDLAAKYDLQVPPAATQLELAPDWIRQAEIVSSSAAVWKGYEFLLEETRVTRIVRARAGHRKMQVVNVYVPKNRPLPQPGVLFTCGHAADGKAAVLYHEACLGLVLKGYVVLALDPTGQGERSEYFEPETGKPLVPLCVSQHHYLARPSWLVGRSLAGYRTWDATRAVDYLVARPEVNPERIGVVGNSGGGIMALLATAADSRIKVCAAAHPGGSMEETYITGRDLPKADLLGLIAPRPMAWIDPVDAMLETLDPERCETLCGWPRDVYRGLGSPQKLQIMQTTGGTASRTVDQWLSSLVQSER